jgi:hypothetical protein
MENAESEINKKRKIKINPIHTQIIDEIINNQKEKKKSKLKKKKIYISINN